MSKHLAVPDAVKAMIERALPGAQVLGLDPGQAKPAIIGEIGQIVVRSGDPGTPAIDFSPPSYTYEREIGIEIEATRVANIDWRRALGMMLGRIAAAIAADTTLGGLCLHLEATAPTDGEMDAKGARPIGWCDFTIVATYTTTSPLG